MLKTTLPPNRFKLADYPSLEENSIDQPIPLGWGRLTGITPVCVDVINKRYKVLDSLQGLAAITEVRSGSDILTENEDYTADLAAAEFILGGMPHLLAGGTYYFAVSTNAPNSNVDYIMVKRGAAYAGGQAYGVNTAGVWNALSGYDLRFMIKGKEGIDGFWVANANCNKIDFKEGAGSELTAMVADGLYSASEYATAIAAALNGTAGRALTYTCTYSKKTNRIAIAASGTFSLLWSSGTNKAASIAAAAGYDDSADDTGAVSYLADDAISSPAYNEVTYLENVVDPAGTEVGLNVALRSKLGQSFVVGAVGFYATSVTVYWRWEGDGLENTTLRAGIYSAISPEVQVGCLSSKEDAVTYSGSSEMAFGASSSASGVECDVQAPTAFMEDGATILNSLLVDVIGLPSTGGTADLLDVTALAAFAAARAETLAVFVDNKTTFEEILGRLETSLRFKFVPLNDGTYAPLIFTSADPEPGGQTLVLRDVDLISFQASQDMSSVYRVTGVEYAERADIGTTLTESHESDTAKFFLANEEEQTIPTYLTSEPEAAQLAEDYGGMYESPQQTVTFEMDARGFFLVPGRDKVRLYRERAPFAGGKLNGVLFRVTKVSSQPSAGTCKVTAQLDIQTYPVGA